MSQKYAELHNLELVESIEDIGVSAFKSKNSEEGSLSTFLKLLESGGVEKDSVLLVESLDRLSRDIILKSFNLFTSILTHGVEIVTLADGQSYTSQSVSSNYGQIFTSLGIMLRANDESVTKSKRIGAAWAAKRSSLDVRPFTKVAPAWIRTNIATEKFELIEHASETIRQIFKWSTDGYGAYAIVSMLNQGDYQPIGKSEFWHKSYVTKILNNRSVYGYFQPMTLENGKKVPAGFALENYYPPVISKEEFLLSLVRIGERGSTGGGRKGTRLSNLFTKLLKCDKCKASVTFTNKGKGPKGGEYLQCSNAKAKAGCKCPPWRYDDFERTFFTNVSEINIKELLDDSEQLDERRKLSEERLVNLKKIGELRRSSDRLLLVLESHDNPLLFANGISNRYIAQVSEIEAIADRNKAIELRLLSLDSQVLAETKEMAKKYVAMISEGTNDGQTQKLRRSIYSALVRTVDFVAVKNTFFESIPHITVAGLGERERSFLQQTENQSDEALEDFLLTAKGNRLLNEVRRSFVVYFKNGSIREIFPGQRLTMNLLSAKTALRIEKIRQKRVTVKHCAPSSTANDTPPLQDVDENHPRYEY